MWYLQKHLKGLAASHFVQISNSLFMSHFAFWVYVHPYPMFAKCLKFVCIKVVFLPHPADPCHKKTLASTSLGASCTSVTSSASVTSVASVASLEFGGTWIAPSRFSSSRCNSVRFETIWRIKTCGFYAQFPSKVHLDSVKRSPVSASKEPKTSSSHFAFSCAEIFGNSSIWSTCDTP